jgi:hypothetical protein
LSVGQKCTSLVSEVFNYYISKMISDGYLDELWNALELREATRDSWYATTGNNNDNNNSNRRRYLKGNTDNAHRSLSKNSISVSGSNEDNSDNIDAEALNLRQMAGTFLLHVVGPAISIIVGLVSFWNKKRRRNNSSCNTPVDNNSNNDTLNQDYPYSADGNDSGSKHTQLQQFEELTKRMDDFQSQMRTMLSLMEATKAKQT